MGDNKWLRDFEHSALRSKRGVKLLRGDAPPSLVPSGLDGGASLPEVSAAALHAPRPLTTSSVTTHRGGWGDFFQPPERKPRTSLHAIGGHRGRCQSRVGQAPAQTHRHLILPGSRMGARPEDTEKGFLPPPAVSPLSTPATSPGPSPSASPLPQNKEKRAHRAAAKARHANARVGKSAAGGVAATAAPPSQSAGGAVLGTPASGDDVGGKTVRLDTPVGKDRPEAQPGGQSQRAASPGGGSGGRSVGSSSGYSYPSAAHTDRSWPNSVASSLATTVGSEVPPPRAHAPGEVRRPSMTALDLALRVGALGRARPNAPVHGLALTAKVKSTAHWRRAGAATASVTAAEEGAEEGAEAAVSDEAETGDVSSPAAAALALTPVRSVADRHGGFCPRDFREAKQGGAMSTEPMPADKMGGRPRSERRQGPRPPSPEKASALAKPRAVKAKAVTDGRDKTIWDWMELRSGGVPGPAAYDTETASRSLDSRPSSVKWQRDTKPGGSALTEREAMSLRAAELPGPGEYILPGLGSQPGGITGSGRWNPAPGSAPTEAPGVWGTGRVGDSFHAIAKTYYANPPALMYDTRVRPSSSQNKGKFSDAEIPSALEASMKKAGALPGPNSYALPDEMGKGTSAYTIPRDARKSDVDALESEAAAKPGPGHYLGAGGRPYAEALADAARPPAHAGTARAATLGRGATGSLDSGGGGGGGGATELSSMTQGSTASSFAIGSGASHMAPLELPPGGKFPRGEGRSEFDLVVKRAQQTPAPGQYHVRDDLTFPSSGSGRFPFVYTPSEPEKSKFAKGPKAEKKKKGDAGAKKAKAKSTGAAVEASGNKRQERRGSAILAGKVSGAEVVNF